MNTDVWDGYHRWYYDTGVWKSTTFMGIPSAKSVLDLWNYQEIIFARKPALVVEFGTYAGGSTLFFSTVLKMATEHSRVLTVDLSLEPVNPRVRTDPHIECLEASTTSPAVAARIVELRKEFPGGVFAILDSDHHAPHVLAELRVLRAVLSEGDYLVVEDSNINGNPVLPGWGEGPLEAIRQYEQAYPDDYVHDRDRERRFGFTFAVNGFLIRR